MNYYLKFDLFDRTTLDDPFPEISKEQKASCSHYGRNCIWIGDLEGIIYKFDRNFTSSMFIAYEKCVSLIYQCKDKDILITSGMDSSAYDVVKLWNLGKWTKQNVPTILRSFTDCNPSPDSSFKVTSLDALNDLSMMVLGLANGKIEVIYSDVLSAKRSKRKQIHKMAGKVTTVAINKENDALYIYSTTVDRVAVLVFNEQHPSLSSTINISSSNNNVITGSSSAAITGGSAAGASAASSSIRVSLDEDGIGCPKVNCAALIDGTYFITNQKGIYEVYTEAVGRCRALDGEKVTMAVHKNYLIVVKFVTPSIVSGTHLSKRNESLKSINSNYQIVIFDRINKFIAAELPVSDFNFLFVEWGNIYVYCGYPTLKMICLNEKDIQSKMKIFFQKNCFNFAISIAKSQKFDEEKLAEMYRHYGEHLYRQKNYEEAVDAYIETIGWLEPSFVIGKFLDTSHMQYLSKYMEELIQKQECAGEHLVLLFNCYIILKDKKKLNKLITNHKTTSFELDSIMNLLRKVKLYEEALKLAERYDRHDWFMKILMEDLKQYDKALVYIKDMPLDKTEEALLTYGDILINIDPEIIAGQLERVCDKQTDSKLSITTILNVFANNRKGLKHFLSRYIVKTQDIGECHVIYVNTYLELLLYEFEKEKDNSAKIEAKIMEILKNDALKYSISRALSSCYARRFRIGYRYLCEKQEKYMEILDSFKLENDIEGVMDTCRRFGSKKPELWVKALEYLTEVNAKEKYFMHVIKEIENNSILSPLLLLQKLSENKNSQFGLVKDYIMRYYEKNEKIISEYRQEIKQLKDETKKNDELINYSNTNVQVFQNLKCMACSNDLEMPSIHFLCEHSFHMRCFESYSNRDEECPKCSPNIEHLLNEINQWQAKDLKLTSLSSYSGALNLEKLWHTVLHQSTHPIAVDPDKFVADNLVKSNFESSGLQEKLTSSYKQDPITKEGTATSSLPIDANSSSNTSKLPLHSLPKAQEYTIPIMNRSVTKAAATDSPKSKRSSPIDTIKAALSNATTIKNPFETSSNTDSVHSNSPVVANEALSGNNSKNPFGEFLDEEPTEPNYPVSKNPFD